MRRMLRRLWEDTRGVSLAITAIMMAALLSMLAFSLDLGLLYTARAEAQRAADAAALAGASAFLNFPVGMPAAAEAEARERVQHYVSLNNIRGRPPSQTTVEVDAIVERSVIVTVRQDTVALWFARLFGVPYSAVQASATAGAVPAKTANCVAPFSFDATEVAWGDRTTHGDPLVTIGPASEAPPPPTGDHYEFVTLDFVGEWETVPDCSRESISIGDTRYASQFPPIENLWAQDLMRHNHTWNPETGRVENESGEPIWNSPQIITVMLHHSLEGGRDPIASDFLLFFVEAAPPGTDIVYGRFLAYASGTEPDDRSHPTMFAVQLTG